MAPGAGDRRLCAGGGHGAHGHLTFSSCVVTVVLAAAAVLGWWGAEPMRARAPATLLTGIGLTAYTALQCVPIRSGGWR